MIDGVMRSDEQHYEDMAAASDLFITQLWIHMPAYMQAAGARPLSDRPVRRLKRKPKATEEWQPSVTAVEYNNPGYVYEAPTYVMRDPCPLCGVRGDIGCKHKVAA